MITQLFGQSDNFSDYSQWQTDDGSTYQTIRFTFPGIVGGRYTINYNAINISTGAAADRVKNVRWKVVNGVATVANKGNAYTNNDTGMNTADVDVIASGSEVIVTVTGVTGQNIRHTIQLVKLSSYNQDIDTASRIAQ
jgi:hypothetical protein